MPCPKLIKNRNTQGITGLLFLVLFLQPFSASADIFFKDNPDVSIQVEKLSEHTRYQGCIRSKSHPTQEKCTHLITIPNHQQPELQACALKTLSKGIAGTLVTGALAGGAIGLATTPGGIIALKALGDYTLKGAIWTVAGATLEIPNIVILTSLIVGMELSPAQGGPIARTAINLENRLRQILTQTSEEKRQRDRALARESGKTPKGFAPFDSIDQSTFINLVLNDQVFSDESDVIVDGSALLGLIPTQANYETIINNFAKYLSNHSDSCLRKNISVADPSFIPGPFQGRVTEREMDLEVIGTLNALQKPSSTRAVSAQ